MKSFCLSVVLLAICAPTHGQTLIHAGRLIDGLDDRPREAVTVVVDGERVVAVESGYRQPGTDDEVIDWRDGTLMPGFIDMHTHLSSKGGKGAYMDPFTQNPADLALRAAANANITLKAGFTTVRDLGDRDNVTVSLRNAINAGLLPGPRIYTASKTLATTGGHADPTNGHKHDLMGDPGPAQGVINSPEDAYKAVRQRYKEGADLIKLTATGGVLSVAKSGENPQFTQDELQAVVRAANDYGFKVAVHAHGKEGIRRAIEAGVTTIEHGTYMDKSLFGLMKKKGVALVPTLSAGEYVAKQAKVDGFYPDIVRPKAEKIGPQIKQTFADAYKAGVLIAFGTDAGVFPHGENAGEFVLMTQAGMDELDAIKSATSVAARVLGDESVGAVEAGRYADFVGVKGNPLEDISLLLSPAWVMKSGETVVQN
ncbi:amidohydrolase family protein [Shewanella sp. GXUN23E]|uniref:metal-dependent hydrolase family protein n=1 Tax=Shewanella sp. GXUN23E TaxID=3422498 RepID=UPI003D7CBB60